jgi:hypothetical protein
MERLILILSRQATFLLVGVVFGLLIFSFSVIAEEASAKGWLVQLDSFHVEKNVEAFVSRIKKKGYTPFVVQSENSR